VAGVGGDRLDAFGGDTFARIGYDFQG